MRVAKIAAVSGAAMLTIGIAMVSAKSDATRGVARPGGQAQGAASSAPTKTSLRAGSTFWDGRMTLTLE